MKDFLLELQTEELPPKLLLKMIENLANNYKLEFKKLGLEFKEIKKFATPRRIAILVCGLAEKQQDKNINKKGPAITANENAILGFAKSNNIEVKNLTIEKTTKGDYYYFKDIEIGQNTSKLLAQISENSIKNLQFPRAMRWGTNKFSFIRPVHSLIMLFGDEIIPANIMNLKSDRITKGMRFVTNNTVTINTANSYQQTMLKEAKIEADFELRKQNINKQITDIAKKNNLKIIKNENLLNEVCAIVEYPVAFIGKFNHSFLELPKEVIINSMAEHQKYFSVTNLNNELTNNFIAIANISSTDMGVVIKGNEKVIHPRLEDAKFFWQQDQKTTLEQKLENLKNVLFMQGLGSMFDKTERIANIAKFIAPKIRTDISLAARAAKLAKADLTSGMVGEFASLQGIMGGYYAKIDGEEIEVVNAIKSHYNPKFSGDELPLNKTGDCVAIADKIDTVCGIFGINQIPTGSKDPYALRRLALGLMRIFIEKKINIDLKELINYTLSLHFNKIDIATSDAIFDFMLERLRSYYREQNIQTSSFLAAIQINSHNLYDLHLRIKALNKVIITEQGKEFIELSKRIVNILKDATFTKNDNYTTKIEQKLNKKVIEIENKTLSCYNDFMQELISIKPILDEFFDTLIVNDKSDNIKNARFTLLSRISLQLNKIGDLSFITTLAK